MADAMRNYKSWAKSAIRSAAGVIGRTLPLSARKAILRSGLCPAARGRVEFSMGMMDDLRRRDPDALHRFLWSNHLAYAATYEISDRFGASNLNPSRRVLFEEMTAHLRLRSVEPQAHIRSIFEVGCSMGYLLRHLEVEVCPSADVLHGLDIDAYAVETGMAHLRSVDSKVQLFAADMSDTGRIMAGRRYDLVLCCGVLMYVNEAAAYQVVRTMMSHARQLVGLICLADPGLKALPSGPSVARPEDGTFIHDVDRMVREAGGRVVSAKRVGTEVSGSSDSHVILAVPIN
jgi:SAM-dependent methyltransferase